VLKLKIALTLMTSRQHNVVKEQIEKARYGRKNGNAMLGLFKKT